MQYVVNGAWNKRYQVGAAAMNGVIAATLLAAGVTDAMQLQTVVPSLTYVATGYSAQPYLRGIGTRLSVSTRIWAALAPTAVSR